MSFGFGVGDFLATLQLADNLKKRFAQAPSGFKAISADVKSLWAVLHDLDDIPKDGLSTTQKAELDVIVQDGRGVLLEIEGKLSKYNVLAYTASDWRIKAARAWSRVKWDPVEIDSLRNRISFCLSLWSLVMSKINQDLTAEIGVEVHAMKDTHDTQLHRELLAWICPRDASEQQHKLFDLHREGTGRWFLETGQFLRWISSGNGGHALLCTGAPGAGKTIITSVAIDHLQKKYAHRGDVVIVYHFFHYQEQLEFHDLLSSFLRQLVQAHPGLHDIITRQFSARWRSHHRLTRDNIQETLKTAMAQFSEVIFVVDAIDECSDIYVRRRFLAWIRGTLEPHGQTKVRFLATARHGDQFEKPFSRDDDALEIEARREDVESFLDGNVTYLPDFLQKNPELWMYIRNQIITSAGGIFLLVRLYYNLILDEKNEKRVRALGQKLHSGWGAYDHAYSETMRRIEQQSPVSQDLAKRALAWVTFCARPLTAMELQNAIAVEIGAPELDATNVTGIDEIASVCCGLLVADKHANTTRVVHLTAQEYLTRTWETWFPQLHDYLTNTCITLGEYSLLMAFLMNDVKVSRCMSEMFGLKAMLRFPGIHLAALLGLDNHVRELLLFDTDSVNFRDHLGRTALIWAAAQGKSTVVGSLIGLNADIDAETQEGFTPLFYAAAYGHVEVVKILLRRGASIHHQIRSGETALFFAARGGVGVQLGPELLCSMGDHAFVARLLLDAGADVNHRNACRQTPLYVAAANGNLKVAELLIERNAYVRSTLASPLAAAAQKGHVAMTQLLLQKDANAGTDASAHFWALSWLAKSELDGEEVFAAMLQDSGSPEFRDELQRLPLHWAASRGDVSLVQRILRAGCTPNPRDIFGRTPLFAAVCSGRVEVVKVLLDHPDIELQLEDTLGFTPLHESYRRHKPDPNVDLGLQSLARPWAEITDLLQGKPGLREQNPVPTIAGTSFSRFQQAQRPLYPQCDVCLARDQGSDGKWCRNCRMLSRPDGAQAKTVIYCPDCIRGAKACPLCNQPLAPFRS